MEKKFAKVLKQLTEKILNEKGILYKEYKYSTDEEWQFDFKMRGTTQQVSICNNLSDEGFELVMFIDEITLPMNPEYLEIVLDESKGF